jgi:hypothetical protein
MSSLLKKATKKIGAVERKLHPGAYISEIVAVKDAPGFRIGDAYVITYLLVDATSGEEYTKEEKYINDSYNTRTNEFLDYLEKNGIEVEKYADFVGIQEQVTLEYQVNKGTKFLNFGSRKFIEKKAQV